MFLCLVENHTKGYNFSKAYKYDNLASSKQNDRDRDIVQQLRGKRLLGQTGTNSYKTLSSTVLFCQTFFDLSGLVV